MAQENRALRVRYELDATDDDATAVKEALAEAMQNFFISDGLDVAKWSKEQFESFVDLCMLTVMIRVCAWGMMRHEQQLEGCTDAIEAVPFE